MSGGYTRRIIVEALRSLLGPPGWWAKVAQLATLAVAVGLGFQPEARQIIEQLASSIGLEVETWHFFLFALLILVVILAFRTSLATTPRVRFLTPKVTRKHFASELAVPIEKLGSGALQFTPRIYVNGKPFALLTEERKKEKDRTGNVHVGRYNLGGSSKDIVIFEIDGMNKKIKIPHQQGDEIYPFGNLNLTLVIDDGDNTIKKEITVLLFSPTDVHVSDGFWGDDVNLYGTAFDGEAETSFQEF